MLIGFCQTILIGCNLGTSLSLHSTSYPSMPMRHLHTHTRAQKLTFIDVMDVSMEHGNDRNEENEHSLHVAPPVDALVCCSNDTYACCRQNDAINIDNRRVLTFFWTDDYGGLLL